jgi:hypothetical protein
VKTARRPGRTQDSGDLPCHELDHWIQWRILCQDLESTVRRTREFVACSSAVADCLTERIGVDPRKVDLVHEFIPARRLASDAGTDGLAVRRELAIPESAFVVGGSGTPDLRKGIDLFIGVAQPVGGGPDYELHVFRSDISGVGLVRLCSSRWRTHRRARCFAASCFSPPETIGIHS